MTIPGARRVWWATLAYVVFAIGIIATLTTFYLILRTPGLLLFDIPGALLGIASFVVRASYS